MQSLALKPIKNGFKPAPLSKLNEANPQDWIQKLNWGVGLAGFPLSLIMAGGIISANKIKDPQYNPTSQSSWLQALTNVLAKSYPIAVLTVTAFDFIQGLLSASLLQILSFGPLLPFSVWNAFNEFKAMNLTKKERDLLQQIQKTENPSVKEGLQTQINNLEKQLAQINAELILFTKIISFGLFYALFHMSILPNLSGDTPLNKVLELEPVKHGKTTLKNFPALVWKNFKEREWPAIKNSFATIFGPKRGSIFGNNPKLENIIKQKNYSAIGALFTRVSGSSLKTVLCTVFSTLRLVSVGLLSFPLLQLGTGVINQNSPRFYSNEDKLKATQNPLSQLSFNLGYMLNYVTMWVAGMLPFLSMSPSYIKSSGLGSASARIFGGSALLSSSVADALNLSPIVGRSAFYIAEASFTFATGLGNIHRSRKK
jgi:hypothetical protein